MANKEVFVDLEKFKLGLYSLEDSTKAPFGSAREMSNMRVTTRGGIAPRQGISLLGTENTANSACLGLYNFRKSYGTNELLIKTYSDKIEVYSKNHASSGWFTLKSGLTADKEFGFVTSLVNTSNEDYVIFCNRYDAYMAWGGSVTLLNGALSGGETSVTVDSTLTSEIFYSGTASSASATTIDISSATWGASQWINLYVYVTSGTHSGKIRKITANTTTQITFDTLGSTPGTATFEIRKLAFPVTGTLIYAGTTIAYTGIPTATTFTVSSAHAAADNTPVTTAPTEYPLAPRGNRLTNYLNRIVVGNVRSAVARDSGGALQGFSSGGSYFVSKISNPFDFNFSATRVAGEGDIISTPYGGGEITDVVHQENTVYVLKNRYIEAMTYSQDADDVAQREPLKAESGAIGPVIKGSDDIYFITADKKFTSLGRVASRDVLPQTDNIGHKIQRILDVYSFGTGRGIEDVDRIYVPCKSSSDETNNNIVLVYNKVNKSFEGSWGIPTNFLSRFNEKTYLGDSTSPNIFEFNTGHADVYGDTRYPITASYATHFMNLSSSDSNTQSMQSLYVEGYIAEGSVVTISAWKDFEETPFLSFNYDGSAFTDGQVLTAALGTQSIGLAPMGSVSTTSDVEGMRHFYFRVYFPYQYGNHFSVGASSGTADDNYEITRFGLGITESVSTDSNRVKTV